ncbi:conserved hypothetical protein [Histoplasma capsulatum var. duboisii H88]|uniref:Uncharacterized protein n=1 Tax=Ajellomyces capsulatus (strain H88) TaxID=544711 RepID=F0USN5_AJEC8|nr:conserved hypothetical protein [Histoplasma capsulatum var. duboisii H88]
MPLQSRSSLGAKTSGSGPKPWSRAESRIGALIGGSSVPRLLPRTMCLSRFGDSVHSFSVSHRQPGDTTRHEQTVPPTHRGILHPPLGGSYGDTVVTFDVIHGIRVGENHWAQVLAVRVVNASPSYPIALEGITTAVAKLYDPLYFDHTDDGVDPFLLAKYHYSRETVSYARLSDLQGTIQELRLRGFSQPEQKQIIKYIIEAESNIYTQDVFLRDLTPKKCLDCAGSRVQRKVDGFSGWVDWDYQPWLRAQFAHTACLVTPLMKSRFLPGLFYI